MWPATLIFHSGNAYLYLTTASSNVIKVFRHVVKACLQSATVNHNASKAFPMQLSPLM